MALEAKQKRRRGWWAETLALTLLTLKGYQVLARNQSGLAAEIDLLAYRQQTLVFVEVKYRQTLEAASLAIHPAQRGRQLRQAQQTLKRYRHQGPWRFDAVLVFPHWPFIKHLKNIYSDLELGYNGQTKKGS